MFIFLLFASDGCRNVCQVFSQRLGAQLLRRQRRARGEKGQDGERQPTQPAHPHWRASLRTWIKCLCGGSACAAPAGPSRIQTLAKLLLQKLLHQA